MTKATTRLLLFMLLGMWSIAVTAQEKRIVSGVVKDSIGNALSGVTISEKGTTSSTTTDMEGRFKIPVSSSNAILVFSSVGFQRIEIHAGTQSFINVSLAGTATTLE